jgi:3-phosphoshikimate 1-carboxyvinyltransferase
LAHAAAVLGLVTTGIEVDGIGGTAKTMPDFVERWQAMLGSRP